MMQALLKETFDLETVEMGQVLQDMRRLALGMQDEKNRQARKLDLFSDSVDKANERIGTDASKTSKLA